MIDCIFRRRDKLRAAVLALAGCMALLITGCGQVPPPDFQLNMQGINPQNFVIESTDSATDKSVKEGFIKGRENVSTALVAMFGEPDNPYVFPESGLDINKIRMAAGESFRPAGPMRGLYRKHCAHCHGVTGDGAGPTAAFLNPYPRDYRKGIYKFKATQRIARPTDEDLTRTLHDGINGTAMPSFLLLPDDEIAALVEYVKYLSFRGESELAMNFLIYSQEEEIEMTRDFLVEQILMPVVQQWSAAKNEIIAPAARPAMTTEQLAESIAKGKELFASTKAQCVNCHGPTGLGDGVLPSADPKQVQSVYDVWNEAKKSPEEIAAIYAQIADIRSRDFSDEKQRQQLLNSLEGELLTAQTWLLPKQRINPRNLRMGIYRFGRTPADLYRRVYAGINGTPMPGFGATAGNPGSLKPEEIWQIVDYITSLPFEAMSQPMGGHTRDIVATMHSTQNK